MFNRLKKKVTNLLPANLQGKKDDKKDDTSISSFEDLGATTEEANPTIKKQKPDPYLRDKRPMRPDLGFNTNGYIPDTRPKASKPLFPVESAPNGAPDNDECAIDDSGWSTRRILPLPNTSRLGFDEIVPGGEGVLVQQYALARPEDEVGARVRSVPIITTMDGTLGDGDWEYVVKDKEGEEGGEWDEIMKKSNCQA
jgi:hypothetical protein